MPFALETEAGAVPVYALGAAADALAAFAGRRVRILGREVDLADEGGRVELWPGLSPQRPEATVCAARASAAC